MVDAQSCGSVAMQGIEAHKLPIGCLVQWVLAEEPLRYCDRGVIVTLLFQQSDQTFRGLEKHLVQAISFRQNPLIIATRQQIAAV